MTVTAARAKRAPVKAPGPQAPAPPPAAPSRRRGITPLTPMRVQAAKSMTRLADSMKESHPDMLAHQHVRDAARMLRSGNEEAAQRHLRAAMFAMTPQSLMRNGLHTDDHHIAARDAMHGIHRHLLLVKDVADVAAKNQAAIARDSYDDDSSSPPPVTSPVRPDPNAGYGPGALAQKPTARQPPGNQALNAPARNSSGGSDPAVADPVGVQPRGSKQFANGIGLSAETGRLAATPAPRGKPGGPGLYGVKGNEHSFYLQQIVKALIRKGMDPGKAYAVAWGSLRRWAGGKGKVHPEVRAAAGGGLAMEKVAEARAHAHAVTWDDVLLVLEFVSGESYVELAAAPPPAAPPPAGKVQPRVPAGQAGGGQFGSGSGQQQAGGKSVASATASKSAKATMAKKAQQKQGLLNKAAGFRAQADALIKQRKALQAQLASASGKTSSGQSGSTTSAGSSTTASSAPAASTAASSTAAATPASTTAASTPAAAASAAAPSTAQVTAQVAQLGTQILALQAQYRQTMAQAAKLLPCGGEEGP